MSKGVIGSLVNAQVAGATVGQAFGPAVVIGQTLSVVGAGFQGLLSGINGLIGSVVTLLPGGSGESGSGGTGGGGGGSSGSGSGGGSGNPLVGPQLGGAEAGQGLGPGADLGGSVPVGDWFPSKGPLGSSVAPLPNVGGILFENCAAELTEIADITGAYWDSKAGALVLVGRQQEGEELVRLGLPSLDRDHLVVALRAYLSSQPLGVSIDPPAEYRDGMKRGITPSDGTAMLVSYLGNTSGTLFGAIMFQADRLLKCLDKGVDNITRAAVRASVPGFVPLLEKITPGNGRAANVWHRFWFVIDRVELKHDADTGAIAFGDVRIKVLTETEMDGQPAGDQIDPLDAEFTRHLSEHYDEYAKDFPILARLKELAKIAAVAKFLCNQKVQLDMGELFGDSPQFVSTPSSTPGISVTSPNVKVEHFGNATRTHTVSLFGGVDMDANPVIRPDDGSARRIKVRAEGSRPSASVAHWTVHENGQKTGAAALRLGSKRVPVRGSSDDHQFASADSSGLMRIRRMYDSGLTRKGDFGPGWFLWVPFSLTVVSRSGKRSEVLTQKEKANQSDSGHILLLHDHSHAETTMFRHIKEKDREGRLFYCRVTDQNMGKDGVSFKYDPSVTVSRQGTSYLLERDGLLYVFDASGCLQRIRKGEPVLVQYERQDGRILRVTGPRGQRYDLEYEVARVGERIAKIATSDGHLLGYSYDGRGLLASWIDGGTCRGRYDYDLRGRLTEERDGQGMVSVRNIYDEFDCPVSAPDVVLTHAGHKIRRSIQEGKIVSASDEKRTAVNFKYSTSGDLTALDFRSGSGKTWRMNYDTKMRFSAFQGGRERSRSVSYNDAGRVTLVAGPRGRTRAFQWGDADRLASIKDERGNLQTGCHDSQGRLQSVSLGQGKEWIFSHGKDCIHRCQGPAGEVQIQSGENQLTGRMQAADGTKRRLAYDGQRGLGIVKRTGTATLRIQYDKQGNVLSTHTEAGNIAYEIDEKSMTIGVTFRAV